MGPEVGRGAGWVGVWGEGGEGASPGREGQAPPHHHALPRLPSPPFTPTPTPAVRAPQGAMRRLMGLPCGQLWRRTGALLLASAQLVVLVVQAQLKARPV